MKKNWLGKENGKGWEWNKGESSVGEAKQGRELQGKENFQVGGQIWA